MGIIDFRGRFLENHRNGRKLATYQITEEDNTDQKNDDGDDFTEQVNKCNSTEALISGKCYQVPKNLKKVSCGIAPKNNHLPMSQIMQDFDSNQTNFNNERILKSLPDRPARIIGGTETTVEQFPWQTRIKPCYKVENRCRQLCGGSIISGHWIVSAAHCFLNVDTKIPYYIVVGETEVDLEKEYKVDAEDHTMYSTKPPILHSEFMNNMKLNSILLSSKDSHVINRDSVLLNFNHDIALLQTNKEIVFSNKVQPICIQSIEQINDVSNNFPLNFMITGWGVTNFGDYTTSKNLQSAMVPLYNNTECKMIYEDKGLRIGEKYMICAGYSEGGIDACQGDSGGPLSFRSLVNGNQWILGGIISFGIGCADANLPGVYTNVGQYAGWIYEHTGVLSDLLVDEKNIIIK